MVHRSFRMFALNPAVLLLVLAVPALLHGQDSSQRGRKYKEPPPSSRVEVTVIRASNGKPVENAAVIFHPLINGKDSGNMELKTNDEGKTVIDLLSLNSMVRLQVIAPGFQTYGEDYKIDKDNMAIEVKLKRPVAQYSIYKPNEGKKPDAEPAKPDAATPPAGTGDAPDKSPDPKDAAADAKPDAAKDQAKPKDTAPAPPPQ